jgi:hypothetical protein
VKDLKGGTRVKIDTIGGRGDVSQCHWKLQFATKAGEA